MDIKWLKITDCQTYVMKYGVVTSKGRANELYTKRNAASQFAHRM